VQYDVEIWMPFFTSYLSEKLRDKNFPRMFKWHEKIHIKLQKFVIFAIWIFFAISNFARIEEMASASLVLFMLIRTL
jgi:hypothetical protein